MAGIAVPLERRFQEDRDAIPCDFRAQRPRAQGDDERGPVQQGMPHTKISVPHFVAEAACDS